MVAAAIVLGFGDEFGSAIGYHADRGLQIEAVAATPLEIASINDTSAEAEYGSGSFNFVAGGAEAARAISIGLLVCSYALVLWAGWRTRVSHLKLGDRAAGRDRRLLAGALAPVPVLAAAAVGRRLRAGGRRTRCCWRPSS